MFHISSVRTLCYAQIQNTTSDGGRLKSMLSVVMAKNEKPCPELPPSDAKLPPALPSEVANMPPVPVRQNPGFKQNCLYDLDSLQEIAVLEHGHLV